MARALGTPLMPWQQHVADVALEVGPDGRLVYREVRLTVPRQSGKTTLLLALMVHRAWGFGGPQRIVYTAQTAKDAREKWEEDHVSALNRSPLKSRYTVRRTNGSEAIRWKNGSIHSLVASTKSSGHGKSLDLAVIDEAFAQPDNRLEQALKPPMITREQPQLWVVSTAGDEQSTYFWEKCRGGRLLAEAEVTDGVCYFEWSAPLDVDPMDESIWWSCMPALGHTIRADAVRADAKSMEDPNDFRRAYLNHWIRADGVINALPGFDECVEPGSSLLDPIVLAVDVAPGLLSASIVACGRNPSGRHHLEVVASEVGTAWVPARLRELQGRFKPAAVMVVPSGPAGALLAPLAAAGVEVTEVSPAELAKASGMLFDEVRTKQVAHLGQPPLLMAVDGAVRKPHGDGGWLWSRLRSSTDISPLVAATIALYGFETVSPAPVRIVNLGDL